MFFGGGGGNYYMRIGGVEGWGGGLYNGYWDGDCYMRIVGGGGESRWN